MHTCLQSLLLREKKKNTDNTDNTEKCRKEKKTVNARLSRQGLPAKFFLEKKTKKYGEDKKTHKRQKSTENSEKTKRHKQHDYNLRAF